MLFEVYDLGVQQPVPSQIRIRSSEFIGLNVLNYIFENQFVSSELPGITLTDNVFSYSTFLDMQKYVANNETQSSCQNFRLSGNYWYYSVVFFNSEINLYDNSLI